MKKIIITLISSVFLVSCNNKEKQTLTFSAWGSIDEINILKPILKEFTKRTGKDVELIHIPDNYFQKLHMMFASDNAPDVIFMNNLTLPVYSDSNVLENLEPWIQKSEKLKSEDFFPQALKAMNRSGQQFGIPRDISNLLIYYNKDMFNRYKITYPKDDWNFEDFLKTAGQLTKDINNDKINDTFGYAVDKRPLFWLPFVWSSGGDIFSQDLKKFTLNSPETIDGLKFYTELLNKHKVAPTEKEVGNAKAGQLFSQEKIGMQLSGRWSVPTYRTSLKFKWDVVPFPKGKSGSIVDVDASGWCISKNSKNKEDAWLLIEHLASTESIGKFSSDGLIVPSRKDIANSKDFLESGEPQNSIAFLKAIDSGRPTVTTQNWNEINTEISLGLENVWYGEESLENAVEKISKRVNSLMK
jgi:multiple sugar transport system substrate-binding protein